MSYLEQAETFIKGILYFILKAKGGKYLSRKQVAGKDGKNKWVYTYANSKGKKGKSEKPVKESKTKADKKSMKTQIDDDDIVLLPDDSDTPPKTYTVEEYNKQLFSKTPKHVVEKIVNSDENEGLKILQSFKGRSQKAKEFEKNIPKNARIAEGEFVSAINSGNEKKIKSILSRIRDHKDTIWVDKD